MKDIDHIRQQAFVDHGPAPFRMTQTGALSDLSFAVKDLFDIAGTVTACGNPDRLEGTPAVATAPSVLAVLAQGAECIGKTHTDEVACGMFGTNEFFGTPVNPAAPDRVPGGSSSGSVSAVAAGLCDFALGSDTGGSVRVPASFCGVMGLRTTYGRITTAGVMAMAPSFDTVGWFARDAEVLKRVGTAYFGEIAEATGTRLLLARDAFDIPRADIGAALLPKARALGPEAEVTLYQQGIQHWLATFRPLQLGDLWATLGDWSEVPGRRVSESIAERMALAKSIPAEAIAAAIPQREALTAYLTDLLGEDGVIMIPTAHDLPPVRQAPLEALIEFREKTLALTCVASLCRLPQLNLPATTVEGVPVGLSFIAGPRGDERLLSMAAHWAKGLAA
ncbi:amidase [Pseudooceanicola nanhaiensis]|uniref:amidase n=1 Tax=Pseudooceanicola nanhaiensis TaxID=375761 RepID=UPI001CD540AA|nr:amidase [Pseudooceanicola nanhaiensis]MCA0919150.1 amidase [Pseudooceanicola nanhaiensis]